MPCISRLVDAPTAGADRRGPGWRPTTAYWERLVAGLPEEDPRRAAVADGMRTLEREREIPGAAQGPARATKHVGVTDVVSLHHQVYPRLPNRLSRRDRLDRSTVCAEARPERTGRNVAFGCCRCRGATLGRPDRPSDRARPHHSLLAAPLGRSRRRGGVCHRPVCLQILRARRLVLLGPRCRCPAHDVSP